MLCRQGSAMQKDLFRSLVAAGIIGLAAASYGGVGQSAVITLVFPFRARSYAMGEVGTALADDGSALYFNPAGLDVPNERFIGGCGTFFYEPLLPKYLHGEIWHTTFAGNLQDPSFYWCSPGAYWNYIDMGVNTWSDELGRPLVSARSYEWVYALGAGFNFKDIGVLNHYFGLTAKYIVSALAPGYRGNGTGVARGIAVDCGYLWTVGHHFRFGATAMNIGPSVYYIDPEKSDPIPFTINLALAYKNEFIIEGFRYIAVAGEFRADREVVKNYIDKKPDPFYKAIWTDLLHDKDETAAEEFQQFNEHLGGEITILNTFSYRNGYLIDVVGERYEFHYGFGIHILNHFSLDYGRIYAPEEFLKGFSRLFDKKKTGASGVRHCQWQISLTLSRALNWSDRDLEWWKFWDDSSPSPRPKPKCRPPVEEKFRL
jgi:hypothetical protein